MNCFESRQLAMDLLDGALPESARLEIERHRESCGDCRYRLERFQQIRSAIARQPWKPLPTPLRSPHQQAASPREDFRTRHQAWKTGPRFMKTGLEGVAIAASLLSLIWVIPRVQSVYQWAQAQRLAELFDSDSLFPGTDATHSARPKRTQVRRTADHSTGPDQFSEETEVLSDEVEANGTVDMEASPDLQKVGGALSNSRTFAARDQEVWRFNLRAASLTDAEENIQRMLRAPEGPLSESDIPTAFHAPGGIQFDLILDAKWINPLQQSLQHYAEKNRKPVEEGRENSSASTGGLTWFRNRSKTTLPAGRSRVIIWVSQY